MEQAQGTDHSECQEWKEIQWKMKGQIMAMQMRTAKIWESRGHVMKYLVKYTNVIFLIKQC